MCKLLRKNIAERYMISFSLSLWARSVTAGAVWYAKDPSLITQWPLDSSFLLCNLFYYLHSTESKHLSNFYRVFILLFSINRMQISNLYYILLFSIIVFINFKWYVSCMKLKRLDWILLQHVIWRSKGNSYWFHRFP